MIKKYHIADIITASRIILASTLIYAIIREIPVDIAIWIIVLCQLGDALDGIFARKYHYPNDGKYRWWRKYASEIDQISDIYAGTLSIFYYIRYVNFQLGIIILMLGIAIGLTIQLLAVWLKYLFSDTTKRNIILVRRYMYLLTIAIVVANLILATTWTSFIKNGCLALAVIIGLILIIIKRDRLTQIKTPL